MSFTTDLRAYADSVNRFAATVRDGARENASDIAVRAQEAVTDLRAATEKVVDIDALRGAVEPYVAQLRGYGDVVTDRADDLITTVKRDPRFGKLFETADSVSAVLVEIVQERVVKPVRSLSTGASNPRTQADNG